MKCTGRSLTLILGLVALFASSVVPACGRVATRGSDSESHFLESCDGSCAGGSSCVCGVCTRACEVPGDCSGLSPLASCRSLDANACGGSGAAPGGAAARVCDVACSQDADCAALGSSQRCAAGYCRSEASGVRLTLPATEANPDAGQPAPQPPAAMSLPPDVVDAATDFSPGELPAPEQEFFSLPPGTTCSDLQNAPLQEPLVVHVRNERSEPIYLQRVQGLESNCFGERQLVQIARDGEDVQIYEETRCLLECADYIAEPGRRDTPSCVQPACSFREVIRIEPGQEVFEAMDREWVRYFLHLPPECRGSVPMDGLINGNQCLRFGPLADGAYTLTARAFTAFEDTNPEDDSACRPPGLSDPALPCLVGVPGTELTAVATTTTPRGDINVVFSD